MIGIRGLKSRREKGGSRKKKSHLPNLQITDFLFAVRTGLEPATPCVTGTYSNQTELPNRFCLGRQKYEIFDINNSKEYFFRKLASSLVNIRRIPRLMLQFIVYGANHHEEYI